MNFAVLNFLGFLSYNPLTLVKLIKLELKYLATCAEVESEVWFLAYFNAPQKIIFCFFNRFLILKLFLSSFYISSLDHNVEFFNSPVSRTI